MEKGDNIDQSSLEQSINESILEKSIVISGALLQILDINPWKVEIKVVLMQGLVSCSI